MFNKLYFVGIILAFLFTSNIYSQTLTISGKVYDSDTKQPLPNTNLFIKELNIGTTSNSSGNFEFNNLLQNTYTITCSYLGYQTITKTITLSKNSELDFALIPKEILLNETIIQGNKATLRETPIAFSEKTKLNIEHELGSQDVPFLLQSTPNLYVSAQGGGTGDLRMNIRGFDQTHFAVMINGIPINNPENGEVYWSNWSGISDVVENIQVQRGLTANPYSSAAVGGLVNIQTFGINSNKDFIKIHSESGSNNFLKNSITFTKHFANNQLSVTGFISKKNWDGYADQTYLKEYTYYLGIGGIFGKHSLELQAIGSPQKHGQRMTHQSIATWKQRGKSYNPDWGYLQGTPLNIRDNEFHNPTINLNHNWQINNNFLISNLIYYIPGKGGGTVPPWTDFSRTEDGLIDFDKEFAHNSSNIDSNYSTTLNKSENALRFFDHTHKWYGFLSILNYKNSSSTFSIGFDYRYYKANNHQEVSNLLGGDYTIGFAGQNNNYAFPLYEGDKIDFNADSFAKHLGGFLQYEYKTQALSIYTISSIAHTAYNRIDYFNYSNNDPQRETGWENFIGYSIKSGVNFNFNLFSNLYFNIGIISKPPIAYNVFDFNNKKFSNVKNENVFSAEIGYGFNNNKFKLNFNTFYTIWGNKVFNKTQQDWATGQFFFLNISGANSKHFGVEMESNYHLTNNFFAVGMMSLSSNKFTSNVITAKSPEDDPTKIEYSTSYVDNTFVPNFPMITASAALQYNSHITKNIALFIKPVFIFIAEHYAQFDPTNRKDPSELGVNSWKLPNSYLLNLHLGFNYVPNNFFVKNISLNLNFFNLLNRYDYIIDAIDGEDHTANSALVWYGRERWWNISVAFSF